MRLNAEALPLLPSAIERPRYDRTGAGIGIVHLGIGAFHRAHQAVYMDDVLAREGGDWRILGVSLRSPAVRDQLEPQDGLYTLVQRNGAVDRLRVIGSVAGVLVAPQAPGAVLDALAAAGTKIVSLTITEKGYCHDPATGRLNPAHPDVVHDLAHPTTPRSAIGYLVEALGRRRQAGIDAPTLLCCDNLPHNGALLSRVVVAFAALRDPALGEWIAANVACPSTMVDRIVPATTATDLEAVERTLTVRDEGMVKAETFTQWVVENRFSGARPDLAAVGVQLVDDVAPFELAKLRMLNGTHSLLAYLGSLAGFQFVHEAIADPMLAVLARRLMLEEAAPSLPAAADLDPASYADALFARFADPALAHRLRQIAMDGSQKLPQRLLGTIRDAITAGRSFEVAALGVAAWMRYVTGTDGAGNPYAVEDPLAARFAEIAESSRGNVDGLATGLLALRGIFGDLAENAGFDAAVRRQLHDLVALGAHPTLRAAASASPRASAA